nr:MAG TPA: hypothetical protein [Caudoviricetes sp.]
MPICRAPRFGSSFRLLIRLKGDPIPFNSESFRLKLF